MLRVWILTAKARKFRANLESMGLILISCPCHVTPVSSAIVCTAENTVFCLRLSRYGRACAKYYI